MWVCLKNSEHKRFLNLGQQDLKPAINEFLDNQIIRKVLDKNKKDVNSNFIINKLGKNRDTIAKCKECGSYAVTENLFKELYKIIAD